VWVACVVELDQRLVLVVSQAVVEAIFVTFVDDTNIEFVDCDHDDFLVTCDCAVMLV
jgi:hypothetical protein